MLLSKDAILQASDLRTEDVEVPEWGGTVRVRMMTGTERDAFEESIMEGKGANRKQNFSNLRAKLVAKCVIGDDGDRLFQGGEDVEALGKKSAKALDRVFGVAQRLNGIGKDDVDDLTGN